MSWFKDRKELYIIDEEEIFDYDPTNPYSAQIEEEEFVEVKIGKQKDDNKFTTEFELPSESKH